MSHRVQGTFALARLTEQNKEKLIGELQEIEGTNVRLDNKGLNITVESDANDFNVLRSRYNEYIYAAKRAELEANDKPTGHLPSDEFLANRTAEAAKQAEAARSATVDGTLLRNPPTMRAVVNRGMTPHVVEGAESEARPEGAAKNLPANSPPPGMTDEGATQEYLDDEATRRLNVPDGGQVNSGANPTEPYVPPQPETESSTHGQ